MFSNAKIGDKVWDFLENWGTIIEINKNSDFPIVVKFNNENKRKYTITGKEYESDTHPRLFWDEIKFEIPEKPFNLEKELRGLEIVEYRRGEQNYYLCWDNECNKISEDFKLYNQNPFEIFFSKKSIDKFRNATEIKHMTKEEFFRVYKKVFGAFLYERN